MTDGDKLTGGTMISAFNMKTDSEIIFDSKVTSLWAVCYGYCEQKKQLKKLMRSKDEGRFIEFAKKLPVTVNAHSVTCGDWCAKR